jgi:membrane protein DedA with SNARE-associated domain
MHSGLGHLVEQYGILGIFLVTLIEGEFGPLVGGSLAELGRLDPFQVLLVSWAGAFLSTTTFFLIGRSQRDGRLVHKVTDKRAFALALKWIDRHPRLFCFAYRFIYGLRIVGPVTISLSHVGWKLFVPINAAASLLWAVILTAIGWFVGPHVTAMVAAWFTPERFAIASVVALIVLLGVVGHRARRAALLKKRALETQPTTLDG